MVSFLLSNLNLNWQVKMATMLIPLAIYGFLFLGEKIPADRAQGRGHQRGGDMFKSIFSPLFIVMFVCMWLTASSELGPNQWIPEYSDRVGRCFGYSGAGLD